MPLGNFHQLSDTTIGERARRWAWEHGSQRRLDAVISGRLAALAQGLRAPSSAPDAASVFGA